MESLQGKVAVITGGASGIGYGMAKQMKAAGMRIMIADVEERALERAAKALGVAAFQTDVRDAESVAALALAGVAQFGTVHVLCNNAGVGSMGRIADLSLADWRWMLDVNLFGVIYGVHHFLPILQANADGGHIISTASLAGLFCAPGLGAYSASKFAVVALMETLSLELAAGGSKVKTSVLIPGPTRTNIASSMRNRSADAASSGLADVRLEDVPAYEGGIPWKSPDEIGDLVIEAILNDDFYIMTHPSEMEPILDRQRRIEEVQKLASARHSAVGSAG